MEVFVELKIMSEDQGLPEKATEFIKAMPNCKTRYLHKGEHKRYPDGKLSKLPIKNSILTISSNDPDYNSSIITMLTIYDTLLCYFNRIKPYTFINTYFYSDDMCSLEFGVDVLDILRKHNFSLPISCYYDTISNDSV